MYRFLAHVTDAPHAEPETATTVLSSRLIWALGLIALAGLALWLYRVAPRRLPLLLLALLFGFGVVGYSAFPALAAAAIAMGLLLALLVVLAGLSRSA